MNLDSEGLLVVRNNSKIYYAKNKEAETVAYNHISIFLFLFFTLFVDTRNWLL